MNASSLPQEYAEMFQDPYASLNPRQRVADIIMEPLLFHGIAKTKEEARERCMSILARVGLRPEQAGRYLISSPADRDSVLVLQEP